MIFGGMNLAMALTATLMKDGVDTDMLKDSLINEAKDSSERICYDISKR